MRETIEILKGETFEKVLINTPGSQWHIVQHEASCAKLWLINMYGLDGYPTYAGEVDNEVIVEQSGESCSTEIYAVAYLKANEVVKLTTRVHHIKGEGKSKQIVKFVLDDEAKGEFYGELKIAQYAQHTTAEQTNRNLLLSTDATMRTRPQLEIYADDVKASHGASTGQLDEAALFYMRQRGISLSQARQLLIGAFVKDVILKIDDEQLRQSLVEAIDREIEQR